MNSYIPPSYVAHKKIPGELEDIYPKACLIKYFIGPGAVAYYNPSTLGGQGGWIMRSRDQDHPGQQGETLSLLKTQKLAGHGGARL